MKVGAFFVLQAEAVVDDLVVTWGQSSADYYQCKNVAGITWHGGAHPLTADFEAQAKLCNAVGQQNARTLLVVPDEQLMNTLVANIPTGIATHTDVVHFPYCGGKLNRLVLEHAHLRASLSQLARVENPPDDELAYVFGALLHGTLKKEGQGSCEELLEEAQTLSPHLIRLMPKQLEGFQLLPGFTEALAEVGDLVYCLSRDFFHWEAFGTSGVFPQNCLSEEFLRFQKRVVQFKPTTFVDFEVLL